MSILNISLGVETGLNSTGIGRSYYIGATATHNLNEKWSVLISARLDKNQPASGSHKYNFGYRDSMAFDVLDSRKFDVLSFQTLVGYRVSNRLTLYRGAQLGAVIKQNNISRKLGEVHDPMDTIGRSGTIDSAFRHPAFDKFNVGFTVGVSMRVGRRVYLEGRFLQNLMPNLINTGLGTYRQTYHTVQLGIRYQFK